ncbi:hypothetical protein Y032_0154g2993 [Ancylostoma ceylanicum]|uniref:Uncharacterized protein n=1 Tax=Ancylostoma ceylanicum TaxID=53326 RepID=A0A016SZ59_9BILA|nr:hypothetical protein Y032_0154g2993 [Ancylostoma ceylanicum]
MSNLLQAHHFTACKNCGLRRDRTLDHSDIRQPRAFHRFAKMGNDWDRIPDTITFEFEVQTLVTVLLCISTLFLLYTAL